MIKQDKIILIGCIASIVIVGMLMIPRYIHIDIEFKPNFTNEELQQYNMTDENLVVITPLLTANAYKQNGFYAYFDNMCGIECLTLPIDYEITYGYTSSANMIKVFKLLGATMITDYELFLQPSQIQNYTTVVLLHNEYVTQEMFDAIMDHPQVIYLYPNALHGMILVYDNLMSLIQGHGFNNKDNGFDWKYDNTRPYEYDNKCENIKWMVVPNGYQLNCYPEYTIMDHLEMFDYIKAIT